MLASHWLSAQREREHRDPPLLGSAVTDRLKHEISFDRCDMTTVIDAYINCMINDIDIDYRAGAGPALARLKSLAWLRVRDDLTASLLFLKKIKKKIPGGAIYSVET